MDDTKEKMIAAATALFAAKGLDAVTVREICAAADVNLALVNYHFRNKEGLYAECVARLFKRSEGNVIADLWKRVYDERTWREAISEWIRRFSRAMHTDAGQAAPAAGFFRQEVAHPSAMHEVVMREYALPIQECLMKLIRMAVDDESEAMEWVAAIWSELSVFALIDPVWLPYFRPDGISASEWPARFADSLCRRIFAVLEYGKNDK